MKKEKIDSLGLSAFCESMAMMLKSGIHTDEAISLLLEENESSGALANALRIAARMTEEGTSASQALAETGVFPGYMIRSLDLGERQGQLEDVFFHLASYYGEQEVISQKIKALIRYPAVMMVTIAVVLAVMLWEVLPVFSGVYESMTGSLNASAFGFIRVSYVLCWIAFVVILALLAVLLVCLALWSAEKGRAFLRELLEKLPVTSGIMETMGLYRFMVALRISLAAGEPQDLAVLDSAGMTECASVEKKLKACIEYMDQGNGIAQAAYHEKLLEPVYGRMLLAGARSGNLESVLTRICELLQETLMEKVDRLSGLVDPVLSGTMMLTVGLSLLSVMLPLIGMMSSIG